MSLGIAYEYKVVRVANGVTGTGYLLSGVNVPMRDYRGKIILLVANNLVSPLSTELLTLQKDLAADGWAVIRSESPRVHRSLEFGISSCFKLSKRSY